MGGPAAGTAVVTGATSGIGAATARLLARSRFDVVVAGRTPGAAADAAAQVRRAAPDRRVDAVWGDLSRQADVRRVAAQVLGRSDRIALLVNNAGANFPRRGLTEGGVEQTLAVDALAPVLLTTLLLPALQRAQGRVVNVASGLLRAPRPGRWTGPAPYSQLAAYAEAKAILVVLTARMAQEHPGVLMVSMTPGLVRTELGRHSPRWRRLVVALAKSTSKRPDAAARGLLHLALAPAAELVPGGFYRRGRPARPRALERVDAEAVWRSALLQFRDPDR